MLLYIQILLYVLPSSLNFRDPENASKMVSEMKVPFIDVFRLDASRTWRRGPWGGPKQASSLWSMRVAYPDHSTNPACGFGSANPVPCGPNSTEANLFHDGESTYRVAWLIWICYSRDLERRCLVRRWTNRLRASGIMHLRTRWRRGLCMETFKGKCACKIQWHHILV